MNRNTVYPSRPGFIVDESSKQQNNGQQISWEDIPVSAEEGGSVVTVATGGAAAAATAVPVVALTKALPAGQDLDFGGAKFARLSAAAAVGAVSLAVDALPTALVAGDVAQVAGDPRTQTGSQGFKFIKAGSAMSRLTAGANKGKLVLRSARPAGNTDPCTCLLLTNANEPNPMFGSDALSGYGCLLGCVVYENLLPDADPATGLIPTAYKTELRAAGGSWIFQVYGDNRT